MFERFDLFMVYVWVGCVDDGLRQCQLLVFCEVWNGLDIEFEYVLVYEFFYVVQQLVVFMVSDCYVVWWVEGMVEWFVNCVVYDFNLSEWYLIRFDCFLNEILFFEMFYEVVVFFFWVGEVYGQFFLMLLGYFGDVGLNDVR